MNRQRRSGYTVQCSAVFALVLACGFVVPPAQSQTLHVLYNFTGGVDGADPFAGLTVDQAGNFYGVAAAGGVQTCGVNGLVGCGTAFVLQRSASGWRFTTLYDFAGGSDGFSPGELSFGPGGAMYGSTEYGGAGGSGIVFRLQPPLGPCRPPCAIGPKPRYMASPADRPAICPAESLPTAPAIFTGQRIWEAPTTAVPCLNSPTQAAAGPSRLSIVSAGLTTASILRREWSSIV